MRDKTDIHTLEVHSNMTLAKQRQAIKKLLTIARTSSSDDFLEVIQIGSLEAQPAPVVTDDPSDQTGTQSE